jgi:hypothetical protein
VIRGSVSLIEPSHLSAIMLDMHRLLLVLVLLPLAACGGSEPASDWTGPPELRPRDGKLEVATFREHAQAVDEEWERIPEGVAREFLNLADGRTTFDGSTVVFLRDDLQDDSIRAERWVLELEQQGEEWELVAARWEQRCHVGRGHQDFSPELCL